MNPELKKRLVSGLERVLAPRVLWPVLLALFLLVSVALWAFRPMPTRSAVLFFPRSEGLSLTGEIRPVLPGGQGLEDNAAVIVEELLLGPADVRLLPALPRGTRLSEILYRRGRLYVDLSLDAIFAESPPLGLGLEAVQKTLKYNFPALGDVILTVGGMEPYAVGLGGPREPKKSKNN